MPQRIDHSANNIPVITNRLYIDTYLFVIIEYLSQRLGPNRGKCLLHNVHSRNAFEPPTTAEQWAFVQI
jgi:hypothetical protein